MSCGCKGDALEVPVDLTLRARAVMGATCPYRARNRCGIGGEPCRMHVHADSCPANRFPDHNGTVLWWGLYWYGVPAPIRWACSLPPVRTLLGGFPRPGPLPGCGCLVAGKRLARAVVGLMAPLRRRWAAFRARPRNLRWVRGDKSARHVIRRPGEYFLPRGPYEAHRHFLAVAPDFAGDVSIELRGGAHVVLHAKQERDVFFISAPGAARQKIRIHGRGSITEACLEEPRRQIRNCILTG